MEIIITLIKIAYQSRGVYISFFIQIYLDLSSSDAHFTLFTNTDLYTASVLWFFFQNISEFTDFFITNGDVLPNQSWLDLAARSRLRDSIKAREPHNGQQAFVILGGTLVRVTEQLNKSGVQYSSHHFFFMWFFRQSIFVLYFNFGLCTNFQWLALDISQVPCENSPEKKQFLLQCLYLTLFLFI